MKIIIFLTVVIAISSCHSQNHKHVISTNEYSLSSINDSTWYCFKKIGNEEQHCIVEFKAGCNSLYLSQLYMGDFDNLNVMAKKDWVENLSNLKDVNWFRSREEAYGSVK